MNRLGFRILETDYSGQYNFNVSCQYTTNVVFNTTDCPPRWGDETVSDWYSFLMLSYYLPLKPFCLESLLVIYIISSIEELSTIYFSK